MVAPAATPEVDAAVTAATHGAGNGLLIAQIGGRRAAVVADEADEAVRVVDLETRTITSTTFLQGAPGQLVLGKDGTLYVAVRGAAEVVALRFRPDGTTREIAHHATSEEPYGLALTPDEKSLLVSTIASPRLEMLRASDLTSVFGTVLPRNPRSIAVSRDGKRAFVSHATGSLVSVVALGPETAGATHTVSLDMRERRRDFGQTSLSKSMTTLGFDFAIGEDSLGIDNSSPSPPSPFPKSSRKVKMAPDPDPPVTGVTMQRTAVQGFTISRIGDRMVLPESMVMTTDGERISSGYGSIESSTLGTNVPFVAEIAAQGETVKTKAFSGASDRTCFEHQKSECIIPRAATDDGARLFVACLDSDEILVIDPEKNTEHAPDCIKALTERPRLHVDSPTAVALTEGGEVVAWSSFTHTLTLLGKPDALPGTTVASAIEVPRQNPVDAEVAVGQRLFHQSGNRKVSADGRACASCHVDGRDDGLVWPTPSGERQTPMLAGRLQETGPYGWNGEHATLPVHIKQTLSNLQGRGMGDKEIDALAAYCLTMHATTTAAKPLAVRGKEVFHSPDTSCSSCHQDDKRFTDGETHKLTKRVDRAFDTPSLAFVGQTAPYFHDGRFPTLDALVEGAEGPHTQMGRTKQLSPDDKRALVAYLQTL